MWTIRCVSISLFDPLTLDSLPALSQLSPTSHPPLPHTLPHLSSPSPPPHPLPHPHPHLTLTPTSPSLTLNNPHPQTTQACSKNEDARTHRQTHTHTVTSLASSVHLSVLCASSPGFEERVEGGGWRVVGVEEWVSRSGCRGAGVEERVRVSLLVMVQVCRSLLRAVCGVESVDVDARVAATATSRRRRSRVLLCGGS